jgi:dienelactone hydrolase
MSITRNIVIGCAALAISISINAGVVDPDLPVTSYVSFQSPNLLPPGDPLTISGQLRIPSANEPIPAVVVLHGSAGLDSRGSLYIEALNDAGIATLEIDMWEARGLSFRPNALPDVTVPDAFSALQYLAANENIDKNRIGILGFSWGGVVAMLAATNYYTNLYGGDLSFAAHVANYPVCYAYNSPYLPPTIFFDDLTGDPVLIQIGDQDDYDDGAGPCETLAQGFSNVDVTVYNNAYHAWDRLQPAITVPDPFSHQLSGGDVEIVPNPGKAFKSRSNVVQFFETEFGVDR